MKRPVILSILSSLLLLVWALWLLPYVHYKSQSLGLDFVIILVWSALVLGASWWEMDWILPKKLAAPGEVVKERRLNLGRSILLVLVIIINFAWTDLTAGDFWFSYYSKYGVYATAMRSDKPEKQLWALKTGAQVITPEFIRGMLPSVEGLTRAKDPVVRGTAFAWLGYGVRQMNLTLAADVPVSVKDSAQKVKDLLISALNGLPGCLQKEKNAALEGCLYAAGWVSGPEYLGAITDVIARTKDKACLVAAAVAAWNIGGLRALSILADLIHDTRGLPRQTAVLAYLKAAAVLVNLGSDAINSPAFDKTENRVARMVPDFSMPTMCVFLQHFSELRDARFSKALAQVTENADAPAICPDIEIKPPVGIPISLALRRDYYECLVNAIAGIAKGNPVIVAAIRNRLSKKIDPRLRSLLQRVLDAAK